MEISGPKEILVLNGGSSSVKFALFSVARKESSNKIQKEFSNEVLKIFSGSLAEQGKGNWHVTSKVAKSHTGSNESRDELLAHRDRSPAELMVSWLSEQEVVNFDRIEVIGHRIVQGTRDSIPQVITNQLLNELDDRAVLDPDHIPSELELIRLIQGQFPSKTQIACYDTTFHASMPPVARALPVPKRFNLQRLGFHGLSYSYLTDELYKLEGQSAEGKVIITHLGSGASMTALHEGKSVDTSMGYTPAAGLIMGTRPGDLDPGVLRQMMISEDLSADELNRLVNHECGLLALSGYSSDMRELLRNQQNHEVAAAIDVFCYQIKKWIGAYAAVLNGLDILVFSGGIGERVPLVRRKVCEGLGFLGIILDDAQNEANAALISSPLSRVKVRVIPTDEELMIAKIAAEFIRN